MLLRENELGVAALARTGVLYTPVFMIVTGLLP